MIPSNATVARVVFVACVVVVAVFGGILAIGRLSHIVTLLVVALFFAVILAPPVSYLVRRFRFPRGAAVGVVFLAGIIAFSALTYAEDLDVAGVHADGNGDLEDALR